MTPEVPPIAWVKRNESMPTTAAAGRVNSQAVAIRPVTPQRTSAPRSPTPVPRIDPVATCVVDSE